MSRSYHKIHTSKSRITVKLKMNSQAGTSKSSIISRVQIKKVIKIYCFNPKAITRKRSLIEKC